MKFPERNLDFVKGEVLLFDKDLNWTSFDLIQKVRNSICRKLGIKKLKVGHAGTLDPLATGLMILCTGKSTRMIEAFQAEEKEYVARIKIGATTPSYDLETAEDSQSDYSHITPEFFNEKLKVFIGEVDQEPPVFSAIKINGKRAFHYARQGHDIDLKTRKILINSIQTVEFAPPVIKFVVVCSKGTYIRSLARDIGKELGCGAYLTGLRRTRIGSYQVEDAWSVDEFLKNLILEETYN